MKWQRILSAVDVQEWAMVYKSGQWCTRVGNGVQEWAMVYKSSRVPGYLDGVANLHCLVVTSSCAEDCCRGVQQKNTITT